LQLIGRDIPHHSGVSMESGSEEPAQSEPFLSNSAEDEEECECEKDRTAVFTISIVTIIFTTVIAVASALSFSESNTNSVLVFVFEMCIDIVSASVVIWRFCPRDKEIGKVREEIGQIVLGVIESIMAVTGTARCVHALAVGDDSHISGSDEHGKHALLIFGIATAGLTLLALGKFWLSIHFNSMTLGADAVDSLTGAAMAFAVVISQIVSEKHDDKLWFFDHAMGLVMSLCVGVFAAWLLYNRRERLCDELHCDCCCVRKRGAKKP